MGSVRLEQFVFGSGDLNKKKQLFNTDERTPRSADGRRRDGLWTVLRKQSTEHQSLEGNDDERRSERCVSGNESVNDCLSSVRMPHGGNRNERTMSFDALSVLRSHADLLILLPQTSGPVPR